MMKVANEIAVQDFERFVESLKISERKLEKLQEEKAELINLIMEGLIIINEDGKLIYKLQYPICDKDNQPVLTEMKFGGRRITVGEMEKKMIGKNDVEKARKMIAYMTGTNSALLEQMDDDFVALGTISAFFLPR
jgi:hypothetical protein